MRRRLVICSDESTTGGDAGDLKNRMIATSTARATTPIATRAAIPLLGCGLTGVVAVAKRERIRSFESGAGLAADPVARDLP